MKLKLLSLIATLLAFGAWQLTLAYDANNDGMSDVYADHYGLAQDSALEDEDGDGFTNLDESLWGTDPTSQTSRFTGLEQHSDNIFLYFWDSVAGKRYGVQFSDNLTDWMLLGNLQWGNGNQITFGTQVIGPKGFWRLKHEGERDADGDGLSLMEENLLGTDDTKADTDGDYILDVNEFIAGTQPMVVDTPPVVSFDPVAGDYQDAQSVELVNLALPNYIYYTEDGTEPTLFSSKYDGTPIDTGPDTIVTIRAKVILPDGTESAESAATYRTGDLSYPSDEVYYGWVTASGQWGYAHDTLSFTLQPGIYTPKNYLAMGKGWIIGGEFIADTTQTPVELYYGMTGVLIGASVQYVYGYSTDSSVFYAVGDARNYRPVGKGWITAHDSMEAWMDASNSGVIYYALFSLRKNATQYDSLYAYTTSSVDNFGYSDNAKPITTGWINGFDSITADTESVNASSVYYGSTGFRLTLSSSIGKYIYSHYPSAYTLSNNRITLCDGWLQASTDSEETDKPIIPDMSQPANPIYFGRRYQSVNGQAQYWVIYTENAGELTNGSITLGAGYLRSRIEYDLAWLIDPQTVYRGTTKDLAGFTGVSNFHVFNTGDLESSPAPVTIGNGWIQNNAFVEYIDDNDGLSLNDEIANGTNPNYFDTDGDLIPDSFEVASAHLDPLVADPLRGEDFDGDGLDTYLELVNGSNPDEFDTDEDGTWDGDEVDYGTDPFDETSKPFDPYDFVGLTLTNPDCQPLGDLGVFQPYNASTGYSVTGKVGDHSSSESERWRLLFGRNTGNRKAESQQFGVVDDYSLNLHGNTIFEITLEHVGTDPAKQTDYDYQATITEKEGFLLSDPDSLLGTYNDVDLTTVEGKAAYLAPIKSTSFSESFSGGDAVGPRYRKVALNGRPMPDSKPEQEAETEQHAEETYVDAFDLSLHHDTSYIYTPLASSDLVLQATASVRETSWSDRSGLKPHEQLTMPFGAAWSSNLCAYVESVETLGDVQTDPISINVIDESGRSQRFATNNLITFFPWPSSRVDKKTWLNTLEGYDTDNDPNGEIDRLVYKKKYGTTLTYDLCDAWFMYSTDRIEGSNEIKRHRYFRLTEVEDRYGNIMTYDYDADDSDSEDDRVSLIPQVIQSSQYPGQFIAIQRSADCRRIEQITDSRANTVVFNYSDVQVFGSTLKQLTSVDYPDGTTKEYSYETALDTQVDADSGDVTNHFHCNIKKITDKNGKSHTFHYALDRSKSYYVSSGGRSEFAVNINYLPENVEQNLIDQLDTINEEAPPGTAEYKLMYGQPRQVVQVDLPDSIGSASFAKTAGTQTTYGPTFSAASGTTVTDALGNVTAYTFGGPSGEGISGEIVDVDDTGDSVSTEWMIYYTQMQVHHGALEGEAGHLGKETFNFDLASGLSLSSMTDFSGNTTTWLFEDNITDGRPLPQLENAAAFMSKWADPTKKTDALGREETYQYGNFRVMSEVNDVHGTVTLTQVDAKGRRDSMTVTDASGTKLREEDYIYADQDADPTNDAFPGFMVEKRVVAYQNLSGEAWEQDLVTKYVPDNRGRLWKEIVDPGGLDLTTEFAYDLNNNRISVKDPRGNETIYAYDKLNRLIQVTNPVAGTSSGVDAVTYVRKLYDPRGNLICEVNEENQYTLHFYDALSRRVKTVRDMDGVGLPTLPLLTEPQIVELDEATHITAADIVTQMSYNAVNSVDTATDPRGTVTKNFYDALQRITHTYTHFEAGDANIDGTENGSAAANSSEKTHTEFLYATAQNTGASGFSTEGFKPTQIIRHDAVRGADGASGLWTLNSHFTYDADYRQTQSRIEYTPGSFNQTDTAYGAITNSKEALVSTVTDALSRDTVTQKDGLKRTTKIVFPDLTEVETRYSSTGLAYESEDELDRITNTEFDLAGRAVLVKAPSVYNALSGTYERPETETIYDAASNVFQTINPLDEVWEFEYDARNRKVKEIQPAVAYVDESGNWQSTAVSPEIETAFDGVGNVISVTDARDFTTTTVYDRANRPTHVFTPSVDYWNGSTTQNAHLVTHTIYDNSSNPQEIWQGHSASVDTAAVVIDRLNVANSYDKLNRLATTAQDVDGDSNTSTLTPAVGGATDITVTNEHDDAGNRVAVEDGESQRTEFYFDGLSRNTAIHYGVTADFSSTAWVDGKRMIFDALRQTHRLMGTTPGNDAMSGFTADADSHVTAYEYDSRDRLTSVDYGKDSTTDRQYTLDAVGNILAVDELDGSTIGTETIADVAYVWDALNRQRAEYSAGDWHVYEYDLAGNRINTHYSVTDAALTDPQDQADGSPIVETALIKGASVVAGRSMDSDYDSLNRLETVTEGTRVSGYRYDIAGNIREKSQPNGDIIKRSFDALGRKAVITGPGASGSELYVYTHTFDLFGNLAHIVETYPAGQVPARTITNTNDGADRLTVEVIDGTETVTTTYGFDRANNRTSMLVASDDGVNPIVTDENWIYSLPNDLNELEEAYDSISGTRKRYEYDNAGNRIFRYVDADNSGAYEVGEDYSDYSYDFENRLITLDQSSGSDAGLHSWAYDYRTRRPKFDKASGSSVTTFSFSGGLSVREYLNGASMPSVEFIRGSDYGGGIGGILYSIRGGTPSIKHYNSRGDVVAETNSSGTLTWQSQYEAFGEITSESGSTQDRQKSNTKDRDITGYANEGFRVRDLETDRYLTRDPLGHIDGPNEFVHVVQSPWSRFDPKGLAATEADVEQAMNKSLSELPGPVRWLVQKVKLDKAISAGMKRQSRAAQEAEATGDPISTSETVKNLAITLGPDIAINVSMRGALAAAGGMPEVDIESEPDGDSSRDTHEEQTKRYQHATSEEGAEGIMKDKKIDPSPDGFVHTKEAETPGETKSPSQLGEESGARSTEKVVEFDRKPTDRTFTPDLTDDTLFPGPVDLSDRNPIIIDPPSDDL